MKPKTAPAFAYETPRQPGTIRAVFLAVLVHAGFFSLIVLGVTWQSRPVVPVQAELWDKLPPAPSKTPDPRPPPEPEAAKPAPAKPDPPPPKPVDKVEPPAPDPAIAKKLEREKRDKDRREKLERERAEKKKAEEAQKKREQEEAAKRRQEEERAKREAAKAREAAAAARKSEIDGYVERIKAKIRARANVPDSVTGNPELHVRLRVLPGGEVLDIVIVKRSANPTYDAAIERGIRSAQPLPVPPANSELFPQFRDLNLIFRHER